MFANFVRLNFAVFAAACIAVIVFIVLRFDVSAFGLDRKLVFIGLPAACCLISIATMFLSRPLQMSLLITAYGVIFATYLADVYVGYTMSHERLISVQSDSRFDKSIPFDTRTGSQVVRDMRAKGIDAQPSMRPLFFIEDNNARSPYPFKITTGNKSVVPLGGISNSTVVLCNENGKWISYKSDRYGFNNPDGVWNADKLDVALVGDSYTNGACVEPGEDVASRVREAHPWTATLGIMGNGALMMLASLKEYLSEKKPRTVFWLFYANDISQVSAELAQPVLARYLQPDFRQGLIEKQTEIDWNLRRLGEVFMNYSGDRRAKADIEWAPILIRAVKLQNIRNRLRLSAEETGYSEIREVLREAKRAVESWNGRLVFVYLPSWENMIGRTDYPFDRLIPLVERLGIPVINGKSPLVEDGVALEKLYYRPFGHFSAYGYKVLGDKLKAYLVQHP